MTSSDGKNRADVAIVGGGPAGLQAAMVLARTRKRVVVFDAPSPPRNAASHGVHNFMGVEGMLPREIRERVWEQIDRYELAELRHEEVTDLDIDESGLFTVTAGDSEPLTVRRVILATGYRDLHPEIEGFHEARGDTIIPCPFCDGYENRDRIWGIVVNDPFEAMHFPAMAQNWTTRIKVIVNNTAIELDSTVEQQLDELGIPIHRGPITQIEQRGGKVEAVTLAAGERVEVETLLWTPPDEPVDLVKRLIARFNLEVNEMGHLATDETRQTRIEGLYAVGDVRGWTGAIESAAEGSMAASMIVHGWFS